ncbi:MAG TPA: tetratricopeptide repeat protein [Gemmatimonadaceae bacterium]|nr:tetratricopeptide repeat protein [Gemmatimonadaceae bacterium]
MSDSDTGSLTARYAALEARLGSATAYEEREEIKFEIVALFHDLEQEIAERTALRESVKALVERWKQLQPNVPPPVPAPPPAAGSPPTATPAPAPAFSGERPQVQADHLGASTFTEKGWNLIAAGDHAGAEKALLKALSLAPGDPQTESLLGWAQMLQEKYDDALLNFQKVLMRQPANSLARINVGYICLKKGIFGEAIEHLSKAIRLDNDRKAALYAHFYLGLVYAEREMYEDAQAFFRKTLTLGPNLIEAYYELGRALWFDDKRDEAMQAWRDGFAANKFNPWGKRCSEMLQHVEAGGEPPRSS